MRMLILFILALPAASAATPPSRQAMPLAKAAQDKCAADPSLRMARRPGNRPGVTRLGDEPPAALALTVYRTVGGCHTPAILREGIGFTPEERVEPPSP